MKQPTAIIVSLWVLVVCSNGFNVYRVPTTSQHRSIRSASTLLSWWQLKARSSDETEEEEMSKPEGFKDAKLERYYPMDLVDKVHNALEKELGLIASVAAIKTTSTYMVEFRDDITQKWMVNFMDYKKDGFEKVHWEEYVQEMAEMDKFEMYVHMRPPKRLSTGTSELQARNVVLRYPIEIQPRKIAHQIVTVREHVCTELMEDMRSVVIENKEAVKFAQTQMSSSLEEAIRTRYPTRDNNLSGSTPLRNRNWNSCAILLTNLALDIVKTSLHDNNDEASIKVLDEVIADLDVDIKKLTPNEQNIRNNLYASGPRALIEQLCYLGMTKGIDQEFGVNYNKLGDAVLFARLALSQEAISILNAQNLNYRYFYTLIKDKGGFSKFNMRQNTKIEVVDLDQLDAEEAAAARSAAENGEAITTSATTESIANSTAKFITDKKRNAKTYPNSSSPSSLSSASNEVDTGNASASDEDVPTSMGPMMM